MSLNYLLGFRATSPPQRPCGVWPTFDHATLVSLSTWISGAIRKVMRTSGGRGLLLSLMHFPCSRISVVKKAEERWRWLWWQEQPKKRQKGLKIPPLLSQLRLSWREDFLPYSPVGESMLLVRICSASSACCCLFSKRFTVHFGPSTRRSAQTEGVFLWRAENKWEKSVNFAHCWIVVRLI